MLALVRRAIRLFQKQKRLLKRVDQASRATDGHAEMCHRNAVGQDLGWAGRVALSLKCNVNDPVEYSEARCGLAIDHGSPNASYCAQAPDCGGYCFGDLRVGLGVVSHGYSSPVAFGLSATVSRAGGFRNEPARLRPTPAEPVGAES